MRVVLVLCLAYSLNVLADIKNNDQSDFFNLHQAVGFFEAWNSGRCIAGVQLAKSYFDETIGSTDSDLRKVRIKLAPMISNPRRMALATIEGLRFELHQAGIRAGLKHSTFWHDTIIDKCR